MATTALAEPKSGPISASPDAAQLRALIAEIIMAEYGSCGIWEIVEAIESVTTGRL